MNNVLIQNVELKKQNRDILIVNGVFAKITDGGTLACPGGTVLIDGRHKAILPALYNTHTHAAMVLMRSYADDMELFPWLNEHIWPLEAKLTATDVYNGTRLAILEMIRSGTVFFNDMYFFPATIARAADEMGVRAAVGKLCFEGADGKIQGRCLEMIAELEALQDSLSDRIIITEAPHAIYTVGERNLRTISERAAENRAFVHIHIAETRQEFDDCMKTHGMTPIAYLDTIGLLNERLLAAHSVWMTDEDLALVADRQAVLSHLPCSNLKLGSGAFRYYAAKNSGCRITIGTDGCASNNNLSMLEEMKFAALCAKREADNVTAAPAGEIYRAASCNGAEAFGIAAGEIAVGQAGDCILVDLHDTRLLGEGDLIANMVYSADSRCIDTVICNGRILMEDGKIKGEEEIIAAAAESCTRLARG